jgi:hypothetical protein
MLSVVGEIGLAFGMRRRDEGAFRWAAPRAGVGGLLARVREWFTPVAVGTPTVFHVTHHKAGSQWVNRIFHALAYERLVMPEVRDGAINVQFLERPIRPGMVYPTVYVTRQEFESVRLPRPWKRFVVVRDLRDTLVSAYFSIKHSHAMEHPRDLEDRRRLHELSVEDGLLFLLDSWLPDRAAVQRSWAGGTDDVLKYEDLLRDDLRILERVLIGHCGLSVTPERLREVVLANRFEMRAGRKPGTEDVASHERKGVAGDWKTHFTDRVAKAFRNRYGSLLVATGYEKNDRW